MGSKFRLSPQIPPKWGGRGGYRWYHGNLLGEGYNRPKFRGAAPKKVGPKVVFRIAPHCPRPGVSYVCENTESESIFILLHTLRDRSRGGAKRTRRAMRARGPRSAGRVQSERGAEVAPPSTPAPPSAPRSLCARPALRGPRARIARRVRFTPPRLRSRRV